MHSFCARAHAQSTSIHRTRNTPINDEERCPKGTRVAPLICRKSSTTIDIRRAPHWAANRESGPHSKADPSPKADRSTPSPSAAAAVTAPSRQRPKPSLKAACLVTENRSPRPFRPVSAFSSDVAAQIGFVDTLQCETAPPRQRDVTPLRALINMRGSCQGSPAN